jgi:hypothetical protein
VIEIASSAGDLILDSFLGSGTTAAVAHKMGRKWIGIELGDHCYTHCLPRLQKVCDGTDQGGISKAVEWKGGGGFKYYDLAPSLLKKDKHGNYVISEEYNADMLAAAMAKQEGFTTAESGVLLEAGLLDGAGFHLHHHQSRHAGHDRPDRRGTGRGRTSAHLLQEIQRRCDKRHPPSR